jgi:hypothetical protein
LIGCAGALKATPKISLDELKNLLPDINAVTLKSDYYKLKRKLYGSVKSQKSKIPKKAPKTPKVSKTPKKNKKLSRRQQVLEYLSKNAETTFDGLQRTFTDIKQATLRNYLSVWKKDQKKEPKKGKSPGRPAKKAQISVKKPLKATKKKQVEKPVQKAPAINNELIDSLKKTIAAQEKTIETMKKTLDLLSPPDSHEEELKGMTLSEIKKIATTYLKGIKELPAKLRR